MYGVPVASGVSPVTPKRSQSSYCFVQSTEANRSGRSDDDALTTPAWQTVVYRGPSDGDTATVTLHIRDEAREPRRRSILDI